MTDAGDVLVERRGHLGHLVLNRPKAINSLTHSMVIAIAAVLDEWESDGSVATVLISGAGERGLCAGGDIVAIYSDAITTDATSGGVASASFWADEYALNAHIARYSKPYVAFMDGVVLGGGVGVSAHGSVRIVTERTRLGMPETGIGFVPDVGGTFLLSRAQGELGTHLALTAASVTGADAIALGLADHFVESDRLGDLALALGTSPSPRLPSREPTRLRSGSPTTSWRATASATLRWPWRADRPTKWLPPSRPPRPHQSCVTRGTGSM